MQFFNPSKITKNFNHVVFRHLSMNASNKNNPAFNSYLNFTFSRFHP